MATSFGAQPLTLEKLDSIKRRCRGEAGAARFNWAGFSLSVTMIGYPKPLQLPHEVGGGILSSGCGAGPSVNVDKRLN